MSDAACSYLQPEKIDDRLFSINLACRQIGLRGGRHPRTLVVVNSENFRPLRSFRETPSFPASGSRRKWPRIQRILAFPLDKTSLDANDGSLAPFERK